MIGVGLDARLGLPFDQLRAAAREAGRLGFESLWTPAGGVPDAFHVCAAWSQDTSLRTGISVVQAARMWTPLGLAAQAATLAQLSSGGSCWAGAEGIRTVRLSGVLWTAKACTSDYTGQVAVFELVRACVRPAPGERGADW
jgi:hypothetical protein